MEDSVIKIESFAAAAGKKAGLNNYKGLPIHAAPGLHEYVTDVIQKYLKKGATIIDLAAGSGALSLRLMDLGYQVEAADYCSDNFRIKGLMPFLKMDLNTSFSKCFKKNYDAIIAVEIIEHLENPRKFIRESYKIINDCGLIFLTTPNISSPVSQASFLRSGNYSWFNELGYTIHGHINPVSMWEIEKICIENNLQQVFRGSFGNPFSKIKTFSRFWFLAKFIDLFSKIPKELQKDIYTCVIKK